MSLHVQPARVPRILVVDDMPDNLFLMNGLFEDRFEVVQAASGPEALKVVMGDNPPEMVLLDIMMPDMDGYEVMRRIRQHPPTAHIPIIFLTALASREDEKLGMDLGAVDYLTKPVDPELVLQRVQAHVDATARQRLLEALAEKLARRLETFTWQRLFNGADAGTIRFDERQRTVLYAEAPGIDLLVGPGRELLVIEIERLAAEHRGHVDRLADGEAVAFFEDPADCVRTAMALQQGTGELQLRIGVHTAPCAIAVFRTGSQWHRTLVGDVAWDTAKVARTAAVGSVAISPETYAVVRDDIGADTANCLVTEEFHDSDLAQVSLTPAPTRKDALSTFAGLSLR